MTESESLLRHETVGERLEICDLCGKPTAQAISIVIDGVRLGTEPIEEMRICPDCHERMYRDELPTEAELTPNTQPDEE